MMVLFHLNLGIKQEKKRNDLVVQTSEFIVYSDDMSTDGMFMGINTWGVLSISARAENLKRNPEFS